MAADKQIWNPNKYGPGKGGYDYVKQTSTSEVADALSAERLGDVTGVAEKAKQIADEKKKNPAPKPVDEDDCSGKTGLALAACLNRKKNKK